MSALPQVPASGSAIALDHVGIVGADLGRLAKSFTGLGFDLTPPATHASGRTANRCAMMRGGGYLELIATVPGQSSATLDRFLGRGSGGHILALEVTDETAALARLHRGAAVMNETWDVHAETTERNAGPDGSKARFAVILPPDTPEGRVLLIRHLTRDRLWRREYVAHRNRAIALVEVVYGVDAPVESMARLSGLAGQPALSDAAGGYRIPLGQSCVRVLPRAAALALFPGARSALPLLGLTIAAEIMGTHVVHTDGVAIRFIPATG